MVDNFKEVVESVYGELYATSKGEGKHWYRDMKEQIDAIAGTANNDAVYAAIAVMSPRMKWKRQLEILPDMLWMASDGYKHEFLRFGLKKNCLKAWELLNGERTEVSGQKVKSFYENLRGNLDEVTIDSWMMKPLGVLGRQQPTKKQYAVIREVIENLADWYGMKPAEMQAILWTAIRKSYSK